jgi:hypothetical protein
MQVYFVMIQFWCTGGQWDHYMHHGWKLGAILYLQTEEVEKTDPDHDEIKKMMQSLFLKLDALSNFHYTPKQVCYYEI